MVTPPSQRFSDIDRERLRTETFLRRIEFFDETPSTNDAAVQVGASLTSNELPALFLAGRQTSGRGRGGNTWWSVEGALAFSLLLEPARFGIAKSAWPALSLSVGGAVAAAVQQFTRNIDIRLKWPNDVYFAGRKLCGILNEGVPSNAERLIIGIGINVNNSFVNAPHDLQSRGTSLFDVTGEQLDRTDLLIAILNQLRHDFTALGTSPDGDRALARQLLTRWRDLCLLTGRSVTIADGSHQFSGTCLGIDDDAALLLQTSSGPKRFISGSIIDFGE